MRVLILIIAVISLFACVANTVNSNNVETHLNTLIGRKYDPTIGWDDGWNKILDTDGEIEFERKWKSGCSYAIKIDKKSSTVQSWRFTSSKEACDNNYAPSL